MNTLLRSEGITSRLKTHPSAKGNATEKIFEGKIPAQRDNSQVNIDFAEPYQESTLNYRSKRNQTNHRISL
jgi:hypothetical protein